MGPGGAGWLLWWPGGPGGARGPWRALRTTWGALEVWEVAEPGEVSWGVWGVCGELGGHRRALEKRMGEPGKHLGKRGKGKLLWEPCFYIPGLDWYAGTEICV